MMTKKSLKPVLFAGFFMPLFTSFAAAQTVQNAVVPEPEAAVIRGYSGSTVVVEPVLGAASDPQSAGDMVLRLQQLEADIRRLNGMVEEQQRLIRLLSEQSLERYIDMDRRLLALSGQSDDTGGQTNGDSVASGDNRVAADGSAVGAQSGSAQVSAEPGEQVAYREAYNLVRSREFATAIEHFNAFLAQYPFGRFAPNAHYWLGELYLVVDPADPELARQNFQLLLDQYPSHAKVPDALYKLGRVHFLKGNPDRAREFFDRVVREFGSQNHPAAQLAQEFLNEQY